tara:strand:- start:42 stop:302 length:261 start_codon:yes stop_codon:yes gene_type:complete
MNLNKQNLINKILYRSKYRGTKEMDILVSSFVKSIVHDLSIDELEDLDKIINLNDEKIIELINNDSFNENYNDNLILKLKKYKENL